MLFFRSALTKGEVLWLLFNCTFLPLVTCHLPRDTHQIAVTRVWVARISSGVPFGAQTAWLSSKINGWPFEVTRVAAVTHWAVTQGTGAPETLNGQPAIT